MYALGTVLIGMAIVVGGVLAFRLHPFLALLLAAFTVAALTPTAAIERQLAQRAAIAAEFEASPGLVALSWPAARIGQRFLVLREAPETGQLGLAGELEVVRLPAHDAASRRVLAAPRDRAAGFRTGDLVVEPGVWQDAGRAARQPVGQRVAVAFGNTCGKIGLLIALAAIVGKCLLESGAADRIVRTALGVTGPRGAPAAFVASGFLLGIPVFFDTVFLLMIPLGKAMYVRTQRNYLLYVLTIVAGATMAHSLVPPTPGPLFVAEQLGVDLGLMMVCGFAVGIFSVATGCAAAWYLNRRSPIPLRPTADFSAAQIEAMAAEGSF
jgi:GntP family gluconate:H+ symporter